MLSKVLNDINDLPKDTRVALYGAGRSGVTFKKLLNRLRPDITIVFFIDTFEVGEKLELQIINPENLSSVLLEFDVILITTSSWRSVEKILNRLDIHNYLITNCQFRHGAIHEYFEHEDVHLYWLKMTGIFDERELIRHQPEIIASKNMLYTDEDRSLFDLLIRNRSITPQQDIMLEHYLQNFREFDLQYFEYINIRCIKTVVEGGVADGNTTFQCLRKINPTLEIYGFEPDQALFHASTFRGRLENYPAVHVFPYALWNCRDHLPFIAGSQMEAGRISEHTEPANSLSSVEAISLDEFVAENNIKSIDFIKLDVEGSEPMVLEGAKKTILSHRPQLAISIYHKKEHLFEIPLYLRDFLEDYIFRLGSYHPTHGEKIFYAIPKEYYLQDR